MRVRFFFTLILAVLAIFGRNGAGTAKSLLSVTIPAAPIAESGDYATQILGNPWDLNEFSDISQYFNAKYNPPSPSNPYFYPRDPVIKDYSVADGVFTGTSVDTVFTGKNGWFMPLYPGYETAVHVGKVGSRYPIKSSVYGCFYIAIKTNSGANRESSEGGPDQYRIFWFADDKLNSTNTYGFSVGIPVYPEIVGVASTPTPRWQLLKIDLRSVTSIGPLSWSALSEWQGLRFEPTIQDSVSYQVDWMRLTNCNENKISVTFSPDSGIASAWVRPEGTTRDILLAQNVNGNSGSYQLDVQGLAPGRYQVGFGTGAATNVPPTCCSQRSAGLITVNQTPLASFQNPSPASGDDFATTLGNAWDFSENSDYHDITCANYGIEDPGYLWLNTPDVKYQPPDCGGTSVSDPTVPLTVVQSADTSQYRYLTYRVLSENPIQDVPNGTIIRWVWSVQGSSGLPGHYCHLVSQDLPYDTGWQTYTVDLWDAFAGSAEEFMGDCSSVNSNWRYSGTAFQLRFDPNENITGSAVLQKIDWIRLTKPISIPRGEIYAITLNKFFPGDIFNTTLYYTTDPENQPDQHLVIFYSPAAPPTPGPGAIYLPLIRNGGDPFREQGDIHFQWDTATVNPGEYYVCAYLDDGLNQSIVCSEAAVTIY